MSIDLILAVVYVLWLTGRAVRSERSTQPDEDLIGRIGLGAWLVVGGTLLLVFLAFRFAVVGDRPALLVAGLALLALAGGMMMRSWWAAVVVPVAMTVAVALAGVVEPLFSAEDAACASCNAEVIPLWAWIILFFGMAIGPAGPLAAAGSWIGERIPDAYRRVMHHDIR